MIETSSPAFVVGVALAIGVLAQVLARHVLVPGIVLLLGAGVLVGPDVLGFVQPAVLGEALPMIVGFGVAIILFEGGLTLDARRLRREALVIRRLITVGAILTAAGGMLAARLLMRWDWPLSILFGTLVIVTGPTVVTPLVRRLRIKPGVSTILEAEGVLIDPIGAIIAVVALEVLYGGETSLSGGLIKTGLVLGEGALIGGVGGVVIGLLLRPRQVIPDGLENIFVLSLVVALFQVSEAILHESGLAAVVAAGIVVGNMGTRATASLIEFKEQLTILMIGLLFVLLAADVRMAEVRSLGWPALATVAALMLVVRPVQVALCTVGTKLNGRERAFLAWIAPRGIVAAAVASLFAETLIRRGHPGGEDLRALVFMVIAVTVVVYGLTGGLAAKWLGVRRVAGRGYAILGAHGLAFALGRLLERDEADIVYIDSNPQHVLAAERAGLRAIYGQGLQNSVLARAGIDARQGCIALTPNEETNLLWAVRVRAETRDPRIYVALQSGPRGLPADQVHEADALVLFGGGHDVEPWASRIDAGEAVLERWRRVSPSQNRETATTAAGSDAVLILTLRRAADVIPYNDSVRWRADDEADMAIIQERRTEAETWLRDQGWAPAEPPAGEGEAVARALSAAENGPAG